ncbi:hypothetical protein ACA910_011212 [Epithemia clementina (nom. ined.)]
MKKKNLVAVVIASKKQLQLLGWWCLLLLVLAEDVVHHFGITTTLSKTGTRRIGTGTAVVEAKCMVRDHNGQHLSLHPWLIPIGVWYNLNDDLLECRDENSCREWTIAECSVVRCKNSRACQGADFRDNAIVTCSRYASCQEAKFTRSKDVVCGGPEATNPCLDAELQIHHVLLCTGRNACVADNANNQIRVQAGAEGIVRCSHGQGGFVCQHMTVSVNHGKRACFGLSVDQPGNCAIVCEKPEDCDSNTVLFTVE